MGGTSDSVGVWAGEAGGPSPSDVVHSALVAAKDSVTSICFDTCLEFDNDDDSNNLIYENNENVIKEIKYNLITMKIRIT